MQTKLTVAAIIGAGLLIAGVILMGDGNGEAGNTSAIATASIEDGVQYIDITARGGYTPRKVKAQAGIPTVLRMKTEGTYDCSLSLVIPDIGYQNFLPQTGVETIEIPVDKTQGTLRGMCSMAMYHFEINFEE